MGRLPSGPLAPRARGERSLASRGLGKWGVDAFGEEVDLSL